MTVVKSQSMSASLLKGSDPIHRDVFQNKYIIRARRVKHLKRHFFVREREREREREEHIVSCSCFWVLQTDLALRDNARLHHNFLHGSSLNILSVREMFSLGIVSTILYMLFYAGDIQNSNRRRLEMATYIFLQVGEICKSRQSCSSTVLLPVKHRHQRVWRFYPRHCW